MIISDKMNKPSSNYNNSLRALPEGLKAFISSLMLTVFPNADNNIYVHYNNYIEKPWGNDDCGKLASARFILSIL